MESNGRSDGRKAEVSPKRHLQPLRTTHKSTAQPASLKAGLDSMVDSDGTAVTTPATLPASTPYNQNPKWTH